jgi:histidinol phosphatase-like enzyme (inositol monophosphatase family)
MDPSAVDAALTAAVEIVEAAGPIALRHFRQPLDVANKASGEAFDPVTQADREVEAAIRLGLAERFPDFGIYGEEQGEQAGSAPQRWVIDPIDGTRAFMTGMPGWGILLGLSEGDACLAGVVHQPFLGETFFGRSRGSLFKSEGETQALRTRSTQHISESLLYCTHPSMFEVGEELSAFERLAEDVRMSRFGGDCYAYCLLAMGQIDLVVEAQLQPYDIIPLIPIIEGAGGVVTNWQGEPAHAGGRVVAAANAALHAATLERLAAAIDA